MIKYIKIYNEFISFILTLGNSKFTEYEKKLLNIILANFDKIAELGTAQGRRGKYLNELIQKEGISSSSELSIASDVSHESGFPFDTLESIDIENFRGFNKKEVVPFERKFTFICGDNGSGKSSLCEALEYSLLGYINEAITRRIPIDEYIKNAKTNLTTHPKLIGKKSGSSIEIGHNSSLYHFCFIEKNRIDSFARISANTPSEKLNLLSTLFGLDEFNNFVNEFTENIENYIDTKGIKNIELEHKALKLQSFRGVIDDSKKQLEEVEKNKRVIIEKINFAKTIDETEQALRAKAQDITKKLSEPLLTQIDVYNATTLEKYITDIHDLLSQVSKMDAEFAKKSDEINFLELFKATVNLERFSQDRCPVCETPITNTTKHPYENAKKRIIELNNIAILQAQRNKLRAQIEEKCSFFQAHITRRVEVASRLRFPTKLVDYSLLKNDTDKIIQTYLEEKQIQLLLDEEIKRYNDSVQKQNLQKKVLQKEGELVNQHLIEINGLKEKEKLLEETIKRHEEYIRQFETENKALIKEVEDEKKKIAINIKYVEAYNSLIGKLVAYKDNLPLQQIGELNQLTLEIYNKINSHDKTYEHLEKIVLPATTDDTILVYFKDDPSEPYEALQILSEGHIRCLGLAILVAKNIRDNLPIMIMDDIVNAIDDDHRKGVCQLIFEDVRVNSKQIILTTHSKMFVKELELYISAKEYSNLISKLIFLSDEHERRIRIRQNITGNYLILAKKCCDESGDKDALYNCRCALENISNRIWTKLGEKYRADLTVKMRTPSVPPDLMTVVSALNSLIKRNSISELSEATSIFDYLIGLETQSKIIWEYLNKGTHEGEGQEDFDSSVVKEIVVKLLNLDSLTKK